MSDFLADLVRRPWSPDPRLGSSAAGLFVGPGDHGLEVVVARVPTVPSRLAMAGAHKSRRAGRAAPVLLVVLHPEGAALCGPSGEKPAVRLRLQAARIERICREALAQPDRHSALRFLSQALPSLDTDLPGLHNEGLLALHNLRHGVRNRADWTAAGQKAKKAVGVRRRELLDALGFHIAPLDNLTHLLTSGDDGQRRTALAVLLRDRESAEAGSPRFNSLSPVTYALKKADDENLSWVVMVQANRVRVYSTATDRGVGRRGRTETYVECQTPLLADSDLAYLWLIFSAEALAPNGSLDQILEESRRFAGDLAERLRERIYAKVVPKLARGIADARRLDSATGPPELARTYDMALTVLFRLLFIAYAEDCDLLPYRTNDAYRRRSLKQKAQELAKQAHDHTPVAPGNAHWQEVASLCEAVAAGNPGWGVPEYDGALFTSDPEVSEAGAELARVSLPNESFEPALRHLLLIETGEDALGPVDFRSLGVREFGTIYEGLLESELAVAAEDLAVDAKGTYVPAKPNAQVVVRRGETYLHNRSGVRKFTGSYYTKPFAVEHLLDKALEPALKDHFRRLDAMDDATAADGFFDFRVADIAMGSGHFLVGAIDRIEKGMADFLVGRDLPGVRNELAGLRQAARAALDDDAGRESLIEDGQLLRRLIARRCIYGVDLNNISVQLARLAVWIHTFVPGLPLSFLDRNLVRGNALVGIGTVDDIKAKLADANTPLFRCDPESLLGKAAKPLRRLANLNDATVAEVRQARGAQKEATDAVATTKALCDLLTASRISNQPMVKDFQFHDWERRSENLEAVHEAAVAAQELSSLAALHFPVRFPEVFLRQRSGFDVILGNPPWKKPKVEEHGFWARYFPGLRGMSQRDQEAEKARFRRERLDLVAALDAEIRENDDMRRALLGAGATPDFPGMGTGDADVYKAFCWRFWRLIAEDCGRIGVVLPRSALQAKGSQDFRKAVFGEASSTDVTTLLNNNGWAFAEIHPQYTVGLVAIVRRGDEEGSRLRMRGPYADREAFGIGVVREPLVFYKDDIDKWNDSASLPLLPTDESADVFAQMASAPRLDTIDDTIISGGGGRQGLARSPRSEMDATDQKHFMVFEKPSDGVRDQSQNSTRRHRRP